jgi:hemerythrin-like domain-containing protein
MLPIEVLVEEHILIIQMVGLLKKESDRIVQSGKVDFDFIGAAVDFFRTYADRYHHGKEEGLLFKGLYSKKMDPADAKMMNELILEHATARKAVSSLDALKDKCVGGKAGLEQEVLSQLKVLTELYPTHIQKEDTQFFNASTKYFSLPEQEKMLADFTDFNRNFISKKYRKIVDSLESAGK